MNRFVLIHTDLPDAEVRRLMLYPEDTATLSIGPSAFEGHTLHVWECPDTDVQAEHLREYRVGALPYPTLADVSRGADILRAV